MSENISYEIITLDTAAPDRPSARVLLIYTGGTFGMGRDESGSLVPFDFRELVEKAPSLGNFSLQVTIVAFTNPIDSSDIKPSHWTGLAKIINEHYSNHDGFVILHGTDTMAYTASALSFILKGLNKPVILTGAQLPITEVRTDALENLITSLEIASAKNRRGEPIISEVCINFNNQLIRGNRAQKVQSSKFDAFNSANYPILANSGIEIDYHYAYLQPYNSKAELTIDAKWEPRVGIIKIFPGITKDILTPIFLNKNVKGIILETFGAGNIMAEDWLVGLIKESIANEVVIINVSQCMGGAVAEGRYKSSKALMSSGVVNGHDLTTEAAVTKLMYLLGQRKSYNSTIEEMIIPISGEITLRDHK